MRKSIATLKTLFHEGNIDDHLLNELKKDERKGVQQLIKNYEKQKLKKLALEKTYEEMRTFEKKNYARGCKNIAGIDEAGRGPLAGPVVAAAVILPPNFKLLGLNDSKLLNETERNEFFDIIKKEAVSYAISIISNEEIDKINILEATKLAMRNAISEMSPQPDHVLIDAVELNGISCTTEAIIKGDAKSISIAAASILAKVTRDRLMKDIHNEYPMYEFRTNMGYGTKHHMENLKKHGISPYHRKSFAPVRSVINE
ncbi:ribonuclease HII [Ornithinibacillus sp. L9]|uniref:Ribonuclease HII n=2 Tax=Ornithinibacillus caprae TaxID=2678566 RepID=A0A6N8FJU9_9BACI|nr:ribonuclease HII [Ornithinibacillus caprae]